MDAESQAFQRGPLQGVYEYPAWGAMDGRCQVALSASRVGVKAGPFVRELSVLLALGIRADGRRELVDGARQGMKS